MPTTSNPQPAFVDTNIFVALADGQDSTHKKAQEIYRFLYQHHHPLITSSDIVGETLTVISKKLGKTAAKNFIAWYQTSAITEIFITPQIHLAAQKIFFSLKSKNVSFIDCTSIAAMKQAKLSLVFTFDQHFQTAGITLAEATGVRLADSRVAKEGLTLASSLLK